MLITYKFVTGEVTEVKISDEIGAVVLNLEYQQGLRNRTETRRHYHYNDPTSYEGIAYGAEDPSIQAVETTEQVEQAMAVLSDSQREVIAALFLDGLSAKEFAQLKGISEAAVSKTKKAALKKMRIFLEQG